MNRQIILLERGQRARFEKTALNVDLFGQLVLRRRADDLQGLLRLAVEQIDTRKTRRDLRLGDAAIETLLDLIAQKHLGLSEQVDRNQPPRSEEHTSELQSLMRT